MITRAQIEKLGALHAVEPTILSLYLAVPPYATLPARVGELITAAEALPVPDLIEEMVSRVLEDGGDVLVADGGSPRDSAHAS